jgi:hypothetical protein
VQIEVETRGFDAMQLRVRAVGERFKVDIEEALVEASETAYRIMLNRIPRDSGRFAGSIEQLPIRYSPGGANGGGFWETEIIAGEDVPYANVVLEGSGLFHQGHPITASNGNIRTKVRPEWRTTTGAKFMVFTPKGHARPIRKKSVAGQPAKTFWLIEAQQSAQAVVEKKIAAMAVRDYLT